MKNNESGFTLIELLIVIVISALLTVGIYATFMSQQRSYAIQTGVTDMQQNARAALALMEKDIRMAGSGIGSSFTVQDFDGVNIGQVIRITHGSPDSVTVVYAAQRLAKVLVVNANQVTLSAVTGFGTNDEAKGTQYIAFESENEVYTITNIDTIGKVLTLDSSPPANLATMRSTEAPPDEPEGPGAWAYLVRAITYQVDTARNTLERVASDQIGTPPDTDDLWDDIANYINDLQIDYPFDPGTGPDNNLLQVTLTSTYTDHEGTVRTREHQAVIQIRNIGL
jgi:prepilin-type N-terminal cleavage/methylation domain-containing protein